MKDVQVAYKCSDLHPYDSSHEVQDLIDRAVERILNEIPYSDSGDGLPRICVEHCQGDCSNGGLLGNLRYLKVYAEGHGPCVVMVY